MKTKKELNALKEEFNAVRFKLTELTEEETEQVTGGLMPWISADLEKKKPEISDE